MENKANLPFDNHEKQPDQSASQPASQERITAKAVLDDVEKLANKAKRVRTQKENTAAAESALPEESEVKAMEKNIFPVDAFPEAIQQIIKETNKCLSFPIDFTGSSILCAAGVAVGNTHKIQAKETWHEGPVLYLALVGKPGTNKSHPLSFAFAPIRDHDSKTYKEYQEQKSEYDVLKNLSPKDKEAAGVGELSKPVFERVLVSDITPESLAEVHKNNPRGICLYSDEIAGWFNNFNRYNSGSEEQFWLSSWSCKPINVDRKSSEPILIGCPFISVVGTIQTGMLNKVSGKDRSQNGFIDRILFAFPDRLKKPGWSEAELDKSITQKWNEIISNLLGLPLHFDKTGNPEPSILHFGPEAHKLFVEWFNRNAKLADEADTEAIAGIYAKFDQYILRFALLLEMLRLACGESEKKSVGVEAVKGAIKLAEYFRQTALKVHEVVSNPLAQLPENKQKLYTALPETFTKAVGLKIALNLTTPIPVDTFNKFLSKYSRNGPLMLFKKTGHGEYEKLI